MKLRDDFVTNSSSTSFVLAMKNELNEDNFLRSIGVEGEFPLDKLFKDLFEAIDSNKEEIHKYMSSSKEGYSSVADFLEQEGYDMATIQKVEELLNTEQCVYYGKISSDGRSSSEVFFCMESFLVCDGDIYFNGQIGGW